MSAIIRDATVPDLNRMVKMMERLRKQQVEIGDRELSEDTDA